MSFESADGRDLYFTTTPTARTALWRIPSSGGKAVKVLDEVMNQSFAPVSRGIYYIDQPAAEARLRFHDIDRRRSVTVASGLGDRAPAGGFAAAPDGRAVFYARIDSSVDDLMLVESFR